MSPFFLGPILELGKSLIDRVFPDPVAKAEAEFKLMQLAQNGELAPMMAQLEINAREASHPSLFVAGGRPAFLWVGAAGFLYAVLGHPFLSWMSDNFEWYPPPQTDTDLLWVVVSGLLGISALRSVEKVKDKT